MIAIGMAVELGLAAYSCKLLLPLGTYATDKQPEEGVQKG